MTIEALRISRLLFTALLIVASGGRTPAPARSD